VGIDSDHITGCWHVCTQYSGCSVLGKALAESILRVLSGLFVTSGLFLVWGALGFEHRASCVLGQRSAS
jgi:hypothetical protein